MSTKYNSYEDVQLSMSSFSFVSPPRHGPLCLITVRTECAKSGFQEKEYEDYIMKELDCVQVSFLFCYVVF
jgi:hypothetical protein